MTLNSLFGWHCQHYLDSLMQPPHRLDTYFNIWLTVSTIPRLPDAITPYAWHWLPYLADSGKPGCNHPICMTTPFNIWRSINTTWTPWCNHPTCMALTSVPKMFSDAHLTLLSIFSWVTTLSSLPDAITPHAWQSLQYLAECEQYLGSLMQSSDRPHLLMRVLAYLPQ